MAHFLRIVSLVFLAVGPNICRFANGMYVHIVYNQHLQDETTRWLLLCNPNNSIQMVALPIRESSDYLIVMPCLTYNDAFSFSDVFPFIKYND